MDQDPKFLREQAIREAKTNLILDAARKVFSEKGYHLTRLEDIAQAAGFSKAALYNYYADKEAIFLNLAIRDFDGLLATLDKIISPSLPFIDNLRSFIGTMFSFFGQNFAFLLTIHTFQTTCCSDHEAHSDIKKQHDQMFVNFKERFERLLETMTRLISLARANGEIGSRLSDGCIADYIGAMIRGVLFQWKITGQMGITDDETNNIVEFISNGIALQVEVKNTK